MIGHLLGHYRILAELGRGGMGAVYRARDIKLDREVAIKVLPAEWTRDAERRARFEREARTIAALTHPNIVTIYSVEEANGLHFLAMELVEGETLARSIPPDGLSVDRFFELSIPLVDAVRSAHARGIVHRDLKPANIMIGEGGRLKVLDFGLAKLVHAESNATTIDAPLGTASGTVMGTAPYMSPEQAEGRKVDDRSDIFSLGIVLYEMATGRRPFTGETSIAILSSILRDEPPRVSDLNARLPRSLDEIIDKCLAKSADRRYQTALDLCNDLNALMRAKARGLSTLSTAIGLDATLRVPNNLPFQATSFIGRDADIAEVKRLLPATKLLTLTGAGGSGKTRLSLQVAGEVSNAFRDGVWFVELAPVADRGLVTGTVANVLGVREEPDRPLLETLLRHLRDRRTMIILDNCEHLLQACAQFADSIIHGTRDVQILATSREALGIGGELAWQVRTLPTPGRDAGTSLEGLQQYAAVRLFIERAMFAHAPFTVNETNIATIAEICRRLDGIPLAIELAAARVKALRVETLLERLDDRFDLLTRGSRTAMRRHQTLRALIEWSHDLLPEPERVFLRRLSVFAGGWTLRAAETVCTEDGIERADVLELLTRLVDKSLVLLDDRAEEPRYKMLETIRQYGTEKAREARESERLRALHIGYYRDLAIEIEPRHYHPDQSQWFAYVDTELENMRAALEWSAVGGGAESGLRLAMALHRYWYARQYCREAYDWLAGLMASPDLPPRHWARARALFVSSHMLSYFGDRKVARELCQESVNLSREIDYKEGIVDSLWMLSRLDPDSERARSNYEESLAIARELDYTWGAMHCLTCWGAYEMLQGNYDEAAALLHDCEKEARKLGGDLDQLADCRRFLAAVAVRQKNYAGAGALLGESMALYEQAGSVFGVCTILMEQGRVALEQGHHGEALQ